MTRRPRLFLVVGVALLALAACGDGDGDDAAPEPTSSTSTSMSTSTTTGTSAPELAATCESERYRVRYPAGWSTNSGAVVPTCRFFDPDPFTVPPATEFLGAAILFDVEAIPYARLADAVGTGEEVLDRRDLMVDGRPALRIEARSRDRSPMVPAGTASLRYLVDLDGSTLRAVTYGFAGTDEVRNRAVLDAMMSTFETRSDGCSAAGFASSPEAQDLPPAVAEMRRSIVAAATACDYERLAELAQPGGFTYSFGGDGDPAGFWRREETASDPLAVLVRLLERPFGSRPAGEGTTQFVWPRAYAYERWDDVPADARRELEGLYGPQDFERFARAGSYTGHRVGITGDGNWLFFVAGD